MLAGEPDLSRIERGGEQSAPYALSCQEGAIIACALLSYQRTVANRTSHSALKAVVPWYREGRQAIVIGNLGSLQHKGPHRLVQFRYLLS